MRKIGVLTADKMGGLSQSFCLQRMREARLDSTIVMSRYFSNSARSDFKVSGAESLLRILDRFRDDDVLLFSRLSKAYLPMARDADLRHLGDGEARRFGLHLHPASEPMTRKAAQTALDGASMSFTVGGFKAAMGEGEPMDVPESENGFEDAAPPRPSVGILLSGKLSEQTVGRCVDEFRQSGMDDVIVFDPNGRTPGCARSLRELAAKIEVGRRPENSNDENEVPKGFDDRVVLCVTEAERVSDACASITVHKGRFQMFGRDGESKIVPAFRFNPSEIQTYGSFSAYAGDLLKAIRFTVSQVDPVHDGTAESPVLESKESPDQPHGRIVTVVFLTHNRTAVACHCLGTLCDNLKLDGRLRYCICDDRSEPGHVEALEKTLREHGVSDYSVKRTTNRSWGLGASMNNGLREAFSISPLALTAEDDWLLERELDLTPHVDRMLSDPTVAAIRLAACLHTHVTPLDDKYWMMFGRREDGYVAVFNNQVALRHRRVYDKLGKYVENVSTDKSEANFRDRFNKATSYGWTGLNVLFPVGIALHTLDDRSLYFTHCGESTVGHHIYKVPERYRHLSRPGAHADDIVDFCMVGDRGYVDKILVLIQNLKDVDPYRKRVHVIGWDLSSADLLRIVDQSDSVTEVAALNAGAEYIRMCMDAGGYKRDPGRYTVPPSGLLKFYIGDILADVDKALYLDGDVILKKPVRELFDINLDNRFCAAVPDIGSILMMGKGAFKLMQGDPSYFNSGVMLLNLGLLRERGMSRVLYERKREFDDRSLMDQDVFNLVFKGSVELLTCRYNFMRAADIAMMNGRLGIQQLNRLYSTNYASAYDARSDASIYHYAGTTKPWKPMTMEWKARLDKCSR